MPSARTADNSFGSSPSARSAVRRRCAAVLGDLRRLTGVHHAGTTPVTSARASATSAWKYFAASSPTTWSRRPEQAYGFGAPVKSVHLSVAIRNVTGPTSRQLGCAPRPCELAAQLDVGVEEVLEALRPTSTNARSRSPQFHDELTQTQIGERLGISQMQVSRLPARTLDSLRAALLDDSDPA